MRPNPRYGLPEDKRYPCNQASMLDSCMDTNASIPAHKALARKIAAQSTVLVKNEGNLLPLDKAAKLRVVLIGGDAQDPYVSGQGSSGVPTSNRLVSPLAAFQARGIEVSFEPVRRWPPRSPRRRPPTAPSSSARRTTPRARTARASSPA